jgi:hypothetical protein
VAYGVAGLLREYLSELDHGGIIVERLGEIDHIVGSVLLGTRPSSGKESTECRH